MTGPLSAGQQIRQAHWHTSTHSGGNNECVAVATNLGHIVPVRDSKHPGGPILSFPPHTWRTFLSHVS